MIYAVGLALWCVIGFVCGVIYAVRYFRYCASIAVQLIGSHHELQGHMESVLRDCDECHHWHRGVLYGQYSVPRTILAFIICIFAGPLSLMTISQYRIELTKKEKESLARINATE